RLTDEPLRARPRRDVVVVRDRFATAGDDLVRHLLRGRLVGACAFGGPAEVVHDDFDALAREEQRLTPADPSARAGHDRDFAVERTHVCLSLQHRCVQRTCSERLLTWASGTLLRDPARLLEERNPCLMPSSCPPPGPPSGRRARARSQTSTCSSSPRRRSARRSSARASPPRTSTTSSWGSRSRVAGASRATPPSTSAWPPPPCP